MKKKIVIAILVLLVAGILLYVFTRNKKPATAEITLSGNIEVTQVQLSFRLPGWVLERLVDEGQSVKTGDIVARMDPRDLEASLAQRTAASGSAQAALSALENGSRPEEIAAAQAAVDQAKQALAELVAGSRPQEVQVAQAAVNSAQAQLDYAQVANRRMQEMPAGAVSKTDQDVTQMNLDVTKAAHAEAVERLKLVKEGPRREQIDQARAALDAAQQRFELVKKGPRQEEIDQARSRLAEATSAVETARLQVSYATLSSPLAGIVLSKNVEAGEFVVAGTPVVTIGDLEDVWLRGYIDGTDLGRVKVGQAVKLRTDSFPDKTYAGTVSFIASDAEFTPKTVQTAKERTRLVYRIKIDVANPEMQLKPGMPADAVIAIDQQQ